MTWWRWLGIGRGEDGQPKESSYAFQYFMGWKDEQRKPCVARRNSRLPDRLQSSAHTATGDK